MPSIYRIKEYKNNPLNELKKKFSNNGFETKETLLAKYHIIKIPEGSITYILNKNKNSSKEISLYCKDPKEYPQLENKLKEIDNLKIEFIVRN